MKTTRTVSGGGTAARRRIAVAMSGGVDSAVAAHLLSVVGHDVVGITLKLFCHGETPSGPRSCCSLDAIEDARVSCDVIGVRHYVVNLEERFGERVVDRFVSDYLAGETPNPCVLCNQHVKFDPLLAKARTFGCEWVATGHYATLSEAGEGPVLARGSDGEKDQSYALWSVARDTLRHVMMPVGGYTKREIRAIAREAGLPVADKIDSQDICFVPDGDYARFVASRARAGAHTLEPGPTCDTSGKRVGMHRGVARFTVGQRRGIGVAADAPLYVVALDAATNTMTVGPREALATHAVIAREVNWVSIDALEEPREVRASIRYRHAGALASVSRRDGGRIDVTFVEPVEAAAPGQSVVFYDGNVLLGGGVIDEVECRPRRDGRVV